MDIIELRLHVFDQIMQKPADPEIAATLALKIAAILCSTQASDSTLPLRTP